jgi:DNA-binding CsgD family transcriptional regulator
MSRISVAHLSLLERQVAFAICAGISNQDAGDALGFRPLTFKHLRRCLTVKMGYRNEIEFATNVNAYTREIMALEKGRRFLRENQSSIKRLFEANTIRE